MGISELKVLFQSLRCSNAISSNPKQLLDLLNVSQGYHGRTTLLLLQCSTRGREYGSHWQPPSSSQGVQAAKKHKKRQQNCTIVKASGKIRFSLGESFKILE